MNEDKKFTAEKEKNLLKLFDYFLKIAEVNKYGYEFDGQPEPRPEPVKEKIGRKFSFD